MNRVDKILTGLLILLTASVLVTGGLAIYLTLTRADQEPPPSFTANSAAPTGDEPSPPAATPSPQARILFTSDRESAGAIYLMPPDGSQRQRISAPERAFCIFPTWSPDHHRLSYLEITDDPDGQDHAGVRVWVSTADGDENGDPLHINRAISNVIGIPPAWSPDGTRLALVSVEESSEDDREIVSTLHVARLDGSVEQSHGPLPGLVETVRWSPAGPDQNAQGNQDDQNTPNDEWLLVLRSPSHDQAAVHLLSGADPESDDADETALTELFDGALAADWSPDGDWIAVGDYAAQTLLILDRDGNPRPLAELDMQPVEIAWSPTGEVIAVTAAGRYRQGYGDGLYLVDVETGEVTTVTQGDGWMIRPTWSADGQRILFTMGPYRNRPGNATQPYALPYANLWVYALETGALAQLTFGAGFEGMGDWSP